MFKKLHSNRDPKDTLYSEIKKEFGLYFDKLELILASYIRRNPKPVFQIMLVLIVVSFILSFTVFRNNGHSKIIPDTTAPALEAKEQAKGLASKGFDQILQTGAAIKETIALKREIETIVAKQDLSAEDSVRLERALDRLEQLNKSLK